MSDLLSFFGQQAFDTHSVEPQTDSSFVPAGKYLVLVLKAETKANKKNTGHLIELGMQILDGQFKGQFIRDWINIEHQESPQCVEIGRRCLAALGQAIGLAAVGNTDQLLQQTVVAHVTVKDSQNSVRTYSSAAQQQVAVAPVAAPAVYTAPVAQPAAAPTPAAAPAPVAVHQAPNQVAPATPPPWTSR